MKRIFVTGAVFVFLLLSVSACKKKENGIRINEKSFPDEAFREYINENIDGDRNGYLSNEEIEQICPISCGERAIESLSGIEVFKNLEELRCESNKLTALDVSGLTNLLRS